MTDHTTVNVSMPGQIWICHLESPNNKNRSKLPLPSQELGEEIALPIFTFILHTQLLLLLFQWKCYMAVQDTVDISEPFTNMKMSPWMTSYHQQQWMTTVSAWWEKYPIFPSFSVRWFSCFNPILGVHPCCCIVPPQLLQCHPQWPNDVTSWSYHCRCLVRDKIIQLFASIFSLLLSYFSIEVFTAV